MMDFESFAKLWPHQLDLLSGPLLEGDDDDDMGSPVNNELITLQNAHSVLESSTNGDCNDSFEIDEVRDELHKTRAPSKGAVHKFCVSAKNSCSSVKKTGLGMVVYVGRKHSTRTDSDEEVDVETVDEELNKSPKRKSALSYRAFSRQMLSVVEDKEILHEVPNVIFANDAERETGLGSISPENAQNHEMKCSATQALNVLQDKEVPHEVPNVSFANDIGKTTVGCKNSFEGTGNAGTKCSTAVLQATDIDTLLEQFEASEGITSQELTKASSLLPEHSKMPVDEKAMPSSPSGKKNVSSYIIQKIKMSSVVKKGPILIPPSHQPKSKTRSSSQNGFEVRKSCRSSSLPFPVNKECASKTTSSKYSFTLDHDYCTSSLSKTVCEKDNDVQSMESKKGYEKDVNLESSCCFSDKHAIYDSGDSVDSCCVKKSEEEYFIPDAEFEVEIAGSHFDMGGEISEKASLGISDLHYASKVHSGSPKALCIMKSDKCIKDNIQFPSNSDQTGPTTVLPVKLLKPSSLLKSFQARTCVNNLSESDSSRSVFSNDRIAEVSLGNSVQHSSNCSSPGTKRKQDNSLLDSLIMSSNKKCCSWVAPDVQNSSHRTLCIEKIDEALWRRTRSPCVDSNGRPFWKNEKQKQIEERRVVYVGKLPEGLKVNDLRECFMRFGPIQDISIHFRESGDNYGFVTFFNRSDAYEVVERGKLDPKLRRFDLCFGGRRQFCRTRYSDLDSVDEGPRRSLGETDFDTLLQKAKAGSQYTKHSSVSS